MCSQRVIHDTKQQYAVKGVLLKKRSNRPGSTPLCGPGGIPSEWSDVCGFVKPPNFHAEWLIRKHCAFEIALPKINIHDETWIHLSNVSTSIVERERERGSFSTRRETTQEIHTTKVSNHLLSCASKVSHK